MKFNLKKPCKDCPFIQGSGNGRAIGYLEEEVVTMRKLENEGVDRLRT